MSRSGYSDCGPDDDEEQRRMNAYRGAVHSAMRGARGQRFLREMLTALDALPVKELVGETLVGGDGVCAMGAVALIRNLDVSTIDPEDAQAVASAMGIAESMAREIAWENDDQVDDPGVRWSYMRRWVVRNIVVQPDEVEPVEEGSRR